MIELNKIYNEDCLEGMKRIPDGYVDMVLTSPPYDNLRKYGGIEWDFDKFKAVAAEITRVMKKGAVCVWVVGDATIDGSETGSSFRQALHFKDVCGLNIFDTMIFVKSNPIPQNQRRYEQTFEYMFVFSKDRPNTFNPIRENCKSAGKLQQWGRTTNTEERTVKHLREYDVRPTCETKTHANIFTYAIGGNPTKHPAVFPERLAIDQLISWSNNGDIVLDPFLGSGTTALACVKWKRRFLGFELNKEYFDIALKRIELELRQPTLF